MTTDLVRRGDALKLLGKHAPGRVAWDLEAAIFRYVTSSTITTDFESKVRQIAWNISVSPTLLATYTPVALVHLDNTTLAIGTAVERWHEEHNADMRRQHVLLHEEYKEDGGTLTCNRCHSRDVDVHQKQTRSADEGMTVFCVCNTCGMRWKM